MKAEEQPPLSGAAKKLPWLYFMREEDSQKNGEQRKGGKRKKKRFLSDPVVKFPWLFL